MARHPIRNALLQALDFFIPRTLKNDAGAYTRAQILTGVIVINLITSLITAAGITFGMSLSAFNYQVAYSVIGQCILLYCLSLYCLRQHDSLFWAGNLTAFSVFSTVLVAVAITGGFTESPFIQMFILVPVMTFLLAGFHAGLFWSVTTMVSLFGLYLAETQWGFYYQLLEIKDIVSFAHILPFVMIGMTIMGLLVYEWMNDGLKKQLNRERNRFAFKASHDALTDLPNREEFYLRLRRGIEDSEINQTSTALVYLDLDGFKPVNDRYGHHAGDKVLKIISARLKDLVRVQDTVARLGGDEFALILLGITDNSHVDTIVSKTLKLIGEPIDIGEASVTVHASAGIALSPQDSTSPEELCQLADWAMYRAKRRKNTYRYVSAKQDAGINSYTH